MASGLWELRTWAFFFWLMLGQSQPSKVLHIWSSRLLFSQNPEDWTLPSRMVLFAYCLFLFISALKTGTAAMVTQLSFLHITCLTHIHLLPPFLLLPTPCCSTSPQQMVALLFCIFGLDFTDAALVFLSLPYVMQLEDLQLPSFSCITAFFMLAELYFLCTHYISFMHAFVDGHLGWIPLYLD